MQQESNNWTRNKRNWTKNWFGPFLRPFLIKRHQFRCTKWMVGSILAPSYWDQTNTILWPNVKSDHLRGYFKSCLWSDCIVSFCKIYLHIHSTTEGEESTWRNLSLKNSIKRIQIADTQRLKTRLMIDDWWFISMRRAPLRILLMTGKLLYSNTLHINKSTFGRMPYKALW